MKSDLDVQQTVLIYRYYLPGAVAVIIASLMMFLSFQGIVAIFEKRTQLADQKEELQEINEKLSALALLGKGELDTVSLMTDTILPKEKPWYEVLDRVTLAAAQNNISIADYSTNPGSLATASAQLQPVSRRRSTRSSSQEQASSYEKMDVSLEVRGKFSDMATFIGRLVEIAPLLNIESITVSARAAEENIETEFLGVIDLSAYWQSQADEAQTGLDDVVALTNDETPVVQEISKIMEATEDLVVEDDSVETEEPIN